MNYVFRLADVGEGIHEAEIVEILVEVGDDVKEDQEIFKVETDKAVVGLPAPVSGKVVEIPNIIGDVVKVGEPLMVFETSDERVEEPAVASPSAAETDEYVPIKKPAAPRRPLATPHTRHLARKLGVEKLHSLYNPDGSFNNLPFNNIVEIPWSAYGIQVETAYKGSNAVTEGSQTKKIVTLDLFAYGKPNTEDGLRGEYIKGYTKNTIIL